MNLHAQHPDDRIFFSPIPKTLKALLWGGLVLLFHSCFENPEPPQLNTHAIQVMADNRVVSGGDILSDGGSEIFQKGICVSIRSNPDMQDEFTIDGYGNSDFTSSVYLPPGQTYYLRAYAVNGAGIGYGEILSVALEPPPFTEVVIMDIGDITGNSVFVRGRVESNQEIPSRGVCWDAAPDPTLANAHIAAGSGTGIFEATITGLSPGNTYHLRAFAQTAAEVLYSVDVPVQTLGFPVLITREITNRGTFVISTGGDILSGGLILEAGVCWSTSPAPTIADDRTIDQLIYESFYSNPYGLLPNTTYYLRAYATNIAGTGYGNEIMVSMPPAAAADLDGNPYSAVTIGAQTWLVENLRTAHYANGETIDQITDASAWAIAGSGAWCHYENEARFEVPYGKLYNWYAVADPRGVCPAGWHVPDSSEWNALFDILGGMETAGDAMKEAGTAHWMSPNSGATNSSGFTALPGGARSAEPGYAYPLGSLGLFWTASERNGGEAQGYYLFDSYHSVERQVYKKQMGLSVRCVKD
jgi:uncharacterized protein (TIGR02145 family)